MKIIKNGTEGEKEKEYFHTCECGCEFVFTKKDLSTDKDVLFAKYFFLTCPEAFCTKKFPIRKEELLGMEYVNYE